MSPPSSWDVPADVFYEILLQYGARNLSFLGLNCRPVSRNFKEAVERVFVTKHLRRIWLHVDTGRLIQSMSHSSLTDYFLQGELETDVELQFYGLD